MHFFCFAIISLLKEHGPSLAKKLNPLYHRMLCLIEIVKWFWRILFFRFCQSGFLFWSYLSLERAWSFISPSLEQTWVRFILVWGVPCLLEISPEDFVFNSSRFYLLCYHLSFEKGGALHLKILNSLHTRLIFSQV